MRRNIIDIINSAQIDLKREYSRIFDMYYHMPYNNGFANATLAEHVAENFRKLDKNLICRCLSIEDFDETYGFRFVEQPQNFSFDYLISFAEYVTNLVYALMRSGNFGFEHRGLFEFIEHVKGCMEDLGYEFIEKEFMVIFVEKNPVTISVAETVNDDLAYSVLEYNHYRLKGDLLCKKNILKNMVDDIETERKDLNNINKSFASDLFQLLNKFIRHNNSENRVISQMSDSELEAVYDEIYQMWLLAKMQLEHAKRKSTISELINKIN